MKPKKVYEVTGTIEVFEIDLVSCQNEEDAKVAFVKALKEKYGSTLASIKDIQVERR